MYHTKPACILLLHGLPPHALPFSAGALTGADSLFGVIPEAAVAAHIQPGHIYLPGMPEYVKTGVLWRAAPEAAGAHGLRGRELHDAAEYDVPAPTYLADQVTSTFALAWKLHADGLLPPWGAVLARRQTEGRGQMRRLWHSPPGNLYVTFRLPDDPNLLSGPASLLTGWLLTLAFMKLGISLLLKWPNDLVTLTHEKVGGILLEERGGVLLAGVGINLAHAPDAALLRRDAATPAGVLPLVKKGEIEGGSFRPAPFFLWRSLVSRVIVEYTSSVAGRSFSQVLAELSQSLAWRGERVAVTDTDGARCVGRYESLSPEGGILLRLENGSLRELQSGSLSRL